MLRRCRSPGQTFPYHFSQRDSRGDLKLGRRFGVDGNQILRVDGPHAAPAEHYVNYKTVQLPDPSSQCAGVKS